MIVSTGFGFLTKDGKITDKYTLPLGEHPLKEGYTQTEVADQAALDAIEVYVEPVDPIDAFLPEVAIAREAQVFSASDLIRLMPYSYTLNELIRYKNFGGGVANGVPYDGLKQVLAGLVSANMILQSDSDKLAGILLEQNIDLGKY